ncbi:restriction endonuclease subunit S [Leuconostoc pseudomesenteroides]|uniref:restriction endonuclease subunit S n=1 Tax=Leuconostoc pseudomesenteroides TaxID=33968 RepID=UPI0039EAC261
MSKKTPEIRFKGFTDDWEERKLGDIAPLRGGFAFKSSKFRNTGVPIVRISNILSSGEVGGDFAYYDEQDKDAKYILPDKSAVLAMSGATTGKVSILSQTDYDKVYQNQRVGYFQPVDYIDYGFISTIVRSELFMMQLESVLVSGAQPNVSSKEIDSFNFMIPILVQEQQKLGSFFKQLDETIALHQRKLDLLKEQKKGFLQKMFPKNGAKVPELRFSGFADDWEERKLKDVTERVRSNDGRMDLPTLTMSASSGWLDQKDRFSGDISGKEKKNYTLLKKGELSYNHGNSKLAKYGVVFSLTNYEEALVPRVYHSFKALENTSADFIEYMFSTKLPDRELGKLVSSGARMDGLLNINYDDFMNIHISIPNYEEQILMSAFFRKLDETIALHQRKLDLLKEQKKGYLQKMFV